MASKENRACGDGGRKRGGAASCFEGGHDWTKSGFATHNTSGLEDFQAAPTGEHDRGSCDYYGGTYTIWLLRCQAKNGPGGQYEAIPGGSGSTARWGSDDKKWQGNELVVSEEGGSGIGRAPTGKWAAHPSLREGWGTRPRRRDGAPRGSGIRQNPYLLPCRLTSHNAVSGEIPSCRLSGSARRSCGHLRVCRYQSYRLDVLRNWKRALAIQRHPRASLKRDWDA